MFVTQVTLSAAPEPKDATLGLVYLSCICDIPVSFSYRKPADETFSLHYKKIYTHFVFHKRDFYLNILISYITTRQKIYVKRNITARSCRHCCSGKAIGITQPYCGYL